MNYEQPCGASEIALQRNKQGRARPCLILCSRPVSAGMLCYVQENAYVIAADAGWQRAQELGIAVDLGVGDYDSSSLPQHLPEVIRLPAEKDETDLFFAAKEALRRGFRDITLLGAAGGRADHTLAALATLLYLAQSGATALLADEEMTARCVGPGEKLRLPRVPGAYLSIFPAEGTARGVRLCGVKYPLTDAILTASVPLGVSNRFTAAAAEISCEVGWLFVLTATEREE